MDKKVLLILILVFHAYGQRSDDETGQLTQRNPKFAMVDENDFNNEDFNDEEAKRGKYNVRQPRQGFWSTFVICVAIFVIFMGIAVICCVSGPCCVSLCAASACCEALSC